MGFFRIFALIFIASILLIGGDIFSLDAADAKGGKGKTSQQIKGKAAGTGKAKTSVSKSGRTAQGAGAKKKVGKNTQRQRASSNKSPSASKNKALSQLKKDRPAATKLTGKESGILRDAAKGKGNFNLGSATKAEANRLGKAWVGPGYKVASDGKTLVSKDGLRQYRPPAFKRNLNKTQANFEQKFPGPKIKEWQANGHLDIKN